MLSGNRQDNFVYELGTELEISDFTTIERLYMGELPPVIWLLKPVSLNERSVARFVFVVSSKFR